MNTIPDIISPEDIAEIVKYGVSPEYAFSVVLAAALGLDIVDNAPDKQLFNNYFAHMIHRLDADEYDNNLTKALCAMTSLQPKQEDTSRRLVSLKLNSSSRQSWRITESSNTAQK